MDQQLHNLSVEVARLRTLADHSYTAINDLLRGHVELLDRLGSLKEQLNQIDMTTCLSLNDRSKGGDR